MHLKRLKEIKASINNKAPKKPMPSKAKKDQHQLGINQQSQFV
jgi:hypothetical protein